MSATRLRTDAHAFCYDHVAGKALFSVNKGFDMIDALEHASALLDCAHQLTLKVGCEQAGPSEAHAAAYLGEMAKALVDACIGGAISAPRGGK